MLCCVSCDRRTLFLCHFGTAYPFIHSRKSPKSNHSHTYRPFARNPNYSNTYAKHPGGGVQNQSLFFNGYFRIIYAIRKCRRADIASAEFGSAGTLPALGVLFRGSGLRLRHSCSKVQWASAPEDSAPSAERPAANSISVNYFICECRRADILPTRSAGLLPGPVWRLSLRARRQRSSRCSR